MLLQVALDKPEHLGILPALRGIADIIEIGTPLLKRFGIAAITTSREICPDIPVLADTKTVDGGSFEANMVFSAGATFMTVLSCASLATHETVGKCATNFGGSVIIDTITESGKPLLLPQDFALPEGFAYVAVHSPTDARLAGDNSTSHIDAVAAMHARGFRVSLAGGIGPATLESVLAVKPEILVVGGAITENENPGKVATWIKERLPEQGLGWPWDKK
ncbi:3-hexulose-6-phosphate synthase [Ensifer adhaerens]|uniref:orotidine 5'-phosphate decarboxylase / HUMPS family protein n=1 Tax=Ensifer adhaerens TaxID=106592 RepID=UPI00156A24F5|nr:orotidine 5'-phosphate decarboxylase / HUMPS family protein [Ensifer adhaerens]NRP21763.1 3-hexulose-6-phosphate synthase [Ensifer adhaerens]